ncbi:MAG: carboxypeptidase-like regulatory domain-containing protein [Bryobacteraceae bacterium]
MTLLPLISLLFAPIGPEQTCSLSGTVFDSVTGQPLAKVQLLLKSGDRFETRAIAARSDAQGRFSFENLSAGSYRLGAARSGYIEADYEAPLRLEPGQSQSPLRFALTPGAAITGVVRDADGDPVEHAHVVIGQFMYEYGAGRVEALETTATDDRGEYRFRGLAKGKYYVAVEPGRRGNPESRTRYAGNPVVVSAGQQIAGADVTMRRGEAHRVRGRITNAVQDSGGRGRASVRLRERRAAPEDLIDRDHETVTSGSGEFEFASVATGSYEVIVEHDSLRGRSEIRVESDIDEVLVALQPAADVSFQFTIDGVDRTPEREHISCFLSADGRSGSLAFPFSAQLTAGDLAPGHYKLHLSGRWLDRYYLAAATIGNQDILANGFTVSSADHLSVHVALRSHGARLSGVTRPGATVLLAPVDAAARPDLFRTTVADQTGRFEFTAIAPAAYRVYAWRADDPNEWRDPDFRNKFRGASRNTTLAEGAHESIDLRLE